MSGHRRCDPAKACRWHCPVPPLPAPAHAPGRGVSILQQVLQGAVRHLGAQLLAHRQQAQPQHSHCGREQKGREQGGVD